MVEKDSSFRFLFDFLQLVEKSNDLGLASQMFYKQAKKANSCCSFM